MKQVMLGNKIIGENAPAFIIAEMSANHNMEYSRAEAILHAAKEAGVDAVKLQTYTADTITLNSDKKYFRTRDNSLWSGTTEYKLYEKAYTPWEWQPKLKELADKIGIILFSSPFDLSSVDFLEEMDVPAYKIASPEIVDIPLIKKCAQTGKTIIISTGVASIGDIECAVDVCRQEGNQNVILLKCTAEYPAPYSQMNLKTIKNMEETFGCPAGLSDHSLGDEIAIAAVAMGAKVIEKHITLHRADGGVDSAFSMEAEEMKRMVERIRHVEQAMGIVQYEYIGTNNEKKRRGRSLFVSADIKKGERFTEKNIRSVRPGDGLHTKYYFDVLGKRAARDLSFAEPLQMGDVEW
mgnify:FL=1